MNGGRASGGAVAVAVALAATAAHAQGPGPGDAVAPAADPPAAPGTPAPAGAPPTATPPPQAGAPAPAAPLAAPPAAPPAPPQAPPPSAAPPPAPARTASLTLSPLHLLFPLLELTAELRPVDHLGLAVIGGIGSVKASTGSGTEEFKAYEVGAQALWYPMNPFHGLQAGAEMLYVKVESDDLGQGDVKGTGTGLAVGPLLGYKLLTSGGFTFVAQGGVQYVVVEAEASDQAGTSAREDASRWIPLLNLNLGYSF